MKPFFCFLLLLCPIFRVSAQDNYIPKYTANIVSGGLTIGDKVPDLPINHISGLKLNDKPVTSARLVSDFKDKLLILDFWATWCAPCRAMIPVMDSLQRLFKDKVLFLPVAYESAAVVAPVLASMHQQYNFGLPDITGDTVLVKLFPHRSLPHYVWIKNGVVAAITEYSDITAENIRRVINTDAGKPVMAVKKDITIPYDKDKPFLVAGNGGDGAAMIYHSVLSGYIPGILSGLQVSESDPVHGQRFSIRNNSFLWLCRLAYADSGRWFPDARIKLLSKDSTRITTKLHGQEYLNWLSNNGWCYELQVPPALSGEKGFLMIRSDIAKLFPSYSAGLETKPMRSLVLVRTSGQDKLKTTGGDYKIDITPFGCHMHNASLSNLITRLERQYMQRSALAIANGTNYTGMVDLDFDAPLTDLKALNAALAKYDLAFIAKDYPAQLLVIKDAKP